jgi:hypothetical protein
LEAGESRRDAVNPAILIPIAIALVGGMWGLLIMVAQLSRKAGVLEQSLAQVLEMKAEIKALSQGVPLLAQRVGQLEEEQEHTRKAFVSDFPRMRERLKSLEDWRGSTRSMRAVRIPRPDPRDDPEDR